MKTGPEPELQLVLCHNSARGRIAVDIDAFVDFDLAITRSLRDLVAKSPYKRLIQPATGRISGPRKPK